MQASCYGLRARPRARYGPSWIGPWALPGRTGRLADIKPNTVGELVASYLATQCVVLASNDVRLRTGAPVVHETRVAVRRLRSTLRVFGDVVDAGSAEELDGELVWYADLLGQVRDREVLSARMIKLIADLPRRSHSGTGRSRDHQDSCEGTGRRYPAAERGDAYAALPTPHAAATRLEGGSSAQRSRRQKCQDWRCVRQKARRKADKRLRDAGDDIEQLHGARKAMKRLRYAAELVEPADHSMKRVARDAKQMQTLLGEHQDAIVAAGFLASR